MKLQKTPPPPPPVITLEYCKQQERERKQAAKKAQARRDIETAKATINDLDILMDVAQRRYYESVKDKDKGKDKDKDAEKALRQIVALRKQIAAAEAKIEKAKYIIKYGG